jgi:O-antigen/teichoic acid export membrane protein
MLRNGVILGTSNVAAALLSLGRNILIARLISVEDFGIASTFAITMSLVEMTGNIALDRLLVQKLDDDSTSLQATAQGLQALRGGIGAAVLLLIAEPLAKIFGVSAETWAFQTLALIPLMRGLSHLDMFRVQREMLFWPSMKVEVLSILGSTIATVPLALWFPDFRVMLYAILLQQAFYTLLSHLVADRPYRWGWDGRIVRDALDFGWPLLLNGVLMFLTFHGDRILVGSLLGMKELGLFSAAFTITLTPTLVIAKTLNTFFLPLLSKVQADKNKFNNLYLVTSQAALLSGVVFAIFCAFAGPILMTWLYGAKYGAAAALIFWLGLMQATRIGKAGPAIVATAKAETKNPMIANVARILTIPIAWMAVRNGSGIATIVGLAILGEFLALLVSLYLLSSRLRLPVRLLAFPLIISFLLLGFIALGGLLSPAPPIGLRAGLFLLSISFLLLLIWSMPDLRKWGRAQHLAY